MNPPTIRGLCVAALLVASTTHIAAQASVSITSLDRTTVPTMGTVTVLGNGFDAERSAISVILTARGAAAGTVPVTFATPTSVKFVVPPMVDSSNGALFNMPIVADVQIVQVTASSVITSNVLGGLTVEPAPPGGSAAGTITRAYLQMTEDLQQSVRTRLAGSPTVVASSQRFSDDLRSLIDAVTAIVEAPARTVSLPTTNGTPLTLTKDSLAIADRVTYALVQQLYAQLQSASSAQHSPAAIRPAADPPACSRRQVGIPELERDLCGLAVQYDRINELGPKILPVAASAVYSVPFALVGGMAVSGLAAAELIGSNMATALGLLVGPATSHITAHAVGAEKPAIGSTLTDVGLSLLDTLAFAGIPITSGINSGVALGSEIEKISNPAGPGANYPKQGVIVAGPATTLPATARPLNLIPGAGIAGPARWLAVAATQQIIALTTATQPPLSAARFNGLYSGVAAGTCTVVIEGRVITEPGSTPVTLSIASGVLTITSGGSGSSPVSAGGQLVASPLSANGLQCQAGGRFWEDATGRAGGLGSTSCRGDGVTCAGTWNVTRR